jgi:hypothetical protein
MAEQRPLDPLQAAQEANAMLAARVQQLEGILYSRAVTEVNVIIDGLTALTGAASRGDPGARQMLGQLANLLDEGRRLASGIVVPNGRTPG